jgi:hypothetical protein
LIDNSLRALAPQHNNPGDPPVNPNARRHFLIRTACAATGLTVATHTLAQAPGKLDEKDPMAVSLGFTLDTTKVDAKKYPAHRNEQRCAGCLMYGGKAADASGPCSLFGNRIVTANSWCSGFSKKPG